MYSPDVRRMTLLVFAHLGSMRRTAEVLGISPASICRWSKLDNAESKTKWPTRTSKVTEAMIALIQNQLREHPATPAWQLQRRVQQVLDVCISRQLISLILNTRLRYSWKRIRKRGPRGSGWSDERIQDFKDRFMQAYASGNLSSWDESSFDQRSHAIYGYAARGFRAILKVPACKPGMSKKHHSLLMGVHMNGSRHSVVLQGSVKSDHFAQFIETCPFPPGTVILLDNHSMHKTQLVRTAAARKQFSLLFVPAYSPEFNPIEMTFGIIKSAFYKLRYTDAFDTCMTDCIDACLGKLSRPVITGCFRHVSKIIDGTGRE